MQWTLPICLSSAIDLLKEKNLVLPADINYPENDDFISIKETTEENVVQIREHHLEYQARLCNHNHQKYEESNEEVGEINCYIALLYLMSISPISLTNILFFYTPLRYL